MLKYQNGPGSNNGTGLFQTLCGLKVRELYERIAETEIVVAA
jgi:phosphoribulokinase